MESLPVEILSEIFSYLDIREILTVSEVSKDFHSIINSRRFLNKIWANFTEHVSFEESTREYVNLKIENAQDDHLIKNHWMISHGQSSITSVLCLKLENIHVFSIENLSNLIMNFVNIKELHLEGIELENAYTITRSILKLPRMEVLKFFYSTNCLLNLFADDSIQLSTFKVCLIPHEDEEIMKLNYGLVARILHNSRQKLRKLNFYEVNFDDKFLEEISSIKLFRLSNFSMSFNSCLLNESKGFQKFIKLHASTLEKFKIRTFDHINGHHMEVLTKHAINIRSLNLIICSSCDYITFSDLSRLGRLEKLKIQPTNYCFTGNLCYAKFIEDKILNYNNISLKHLTLEMIPNSEIIIKRIIISFPNLITLNLSSEFPMEDHLHLLKSKLKCLKKLIFNCVQF